MVGLGLLTALRVVVMITLATLFWTAHRGLDRAAPAGGAAGAAARPVRGGLPANLLFPVAVVLITSLALNPNVWLSP